MQSRPKASALKVVEQSYSDMSDPREQIRAVSKAGFAKRRIMNSSEFRVFQIAEDAVRSLDRGHRVMAQVSLGEVIEPKTPTDAKADWRRAHAAINSKRVDCAIIDRAGFLALVIEYQGAGHYRDTSFMRDAVKREALRKAKVAWLEIEAEFDPEHVKQEILRKLSG